MGDRMNLLFICSQNKRRSLMAEKNFSWEQWKMMVSVLSLKNVMACQQGIW